jgi:hypothetical protein
VFCLLPSKQRLCELGAVHLQVGGNVREDAVQGTDVEGFVVRDGDVVLGAFEGGCEAEVTPGLARDCVAVLRQ